MEERHLRVPRTARYHVLGEPARARRLWIVLHGYGHLARYFLNKFLGAEKDQCIVAPEGLSRFYLDPEHRRVGATWMTREDRELEIQDQITYLDSLHHALLPELAKNIPAGVLGFSQGVATACRWAMHGNTILDRMVLWGGGIPPELERTALQQGLQRVHVALVHGNDDALVPLSVLENNQLRLNAAQVRHEVHTFKGGHDLDPVVLQRCLAL